MKVVQKILSHGLLISFFVAVFLLYLYRGVLFPQWFGAGSATDGSTQTAAVDRTPGPAAPVADQPPERPPVKPPAPERAPAPRPALRPAPAPQTDAAGLPPLVVDDEDSGQASGLPPLVTGDEPPPAPAPRRLPPPVAEPQMPDRSPVAPEGSGDGAAAPEPEPEPSSPEPQIAAPPAQTAPPTEAREPEMPPSAAPAPMPPVEPAGQRSVDAPAAPSPAMAAPSDYQGQLADARQLFWQKDLDGALYAYTRLVQGWPERADGWGELGNLYMSMGQKDNAAGAYYQAIGLLIQQGETGQARKMLGVMHTLDPAKAEELNEWLEQAER